MTNKPYTTMLNAGIGMVEETKILLDLWQPGMSAEELNRLALQSGRFPQIAARRLRNLIGECFRPRYLVRDGQPAGHLKVLKDAISSREFNQLLFLFSCRESSVLADFVMQIYWPAYAAGKQVLSNEDARAFVTQASQAGLTAKPWSEETLERVAQYLTRTLADFGLLEAGRKRARAILPFRLEPRVAVYLAYDLHFAGVGDNSVLNYPDWGLFGLTRDDVLAELKRLTLQGWFIVQSGGGVVRIGWQYNSMEEVVNVLARG